MEKIRKRVAKNSDRNIFLRAIYRSLRGFFHFKMRNGETVGGAATFYILLSFCPMVLLIISLFGQVTGNVQLATNEVLAGVKSVFPHMAPWIMNSIQKIVQSQLSSSAGFDIMNILVLGYASLGVVSSLMFGIETVAHAEPKGAFFWQDLKSIFLGCLMALFIVCLLLLSQEKLILAQLENAGIPWAKKGGSLILRSNILQAFLGVIFFTLYYKFIPPLKVKFKDAFVGSMVFITSFFAGKYAYFLYLDRVKNDLGQNFGNFYTLVLVVLWVYYLVCSFFYAASVAYVDYEDTPPALPVAAPQMKKTA